MKCPLSVYIFLKCLYLSYNSLVIAATFKEEPVDTLAVKGNETILQCTFNDFVPSNEDLLWIRGNSPSIISTGNNLYLEDEYELIGNYDDGEYSLRILNVTSDDTYTCSAPRSNLDSSADLIVLESGPLCDVSPESTNVEGRNTTFTCTSIKGVPPGESVWTINGVEESRKSDPVHSYSKVFSRDEQGSTLNCGIQHPTLSDELESGLVCESDIIMNIQYPPIVNVTNTTDNVVVEGDDYFAQCQVQERGNPDVIERWYWSLPNGSMYDNGTLAIYDATREDNGTYTCVAENKYFDNSRGYGNASIELSVHYKPVAVINDESDGRVIEGRKYTAECDVDANPPAVISWTSPDGGTASDNYLLVLNDTQRTDRGPYTCNATNTFFNNEQGYGNASLEIDVQFSPNVTIDFHGYMSDKGQVVEGEDIQQECKVIAANPEVDDIQWKNASDSNWLNFTDIERGQHGTYTCIANNTFWNNETGSAYIDVLLDVQYSPEIHNFSRNKIIVEGETLKVVCRASGNPDPIIQWEFDGLNITENETLTKVNISRHSGGNYTCQATNTFWDKVSTNTSETLNLDVQYPPTVGVHPRYVLKEYDNITMLCNVTDANPPEVTYTWVLVGSETVTDAALRLTNVTRNEAGLYTCIGRNVYYNGNNGTGMDTTTLDVQYGPEIEVQNTNVVIKENDSLNLICIIDSNPMVDYHNWTKDGVILTSSFSYKIDKIDREDAGTYNCIARTTFYNNDVVDAYSTTNVTVQYISSVDVVGPLEAVKEGTLVVITCTVTDGLPDPHSIALYHVNETVNEVESIDNENGVTNHTFDLGLIQRWNNGSYYCEANTTFADQSVDSGMSTKIPIIVHYKPSISDGDKETIDVKIGSPVSLICTADAFPDADITWKKDGENLDVGQDSSTHTIASVVENDGGKYICIAENYLGSAQREIQLNVILSQGQADIPLIAGISAGILLLLIVIIVLAVMIKRQKKPDKKKNEASEMSPLHFQQTPQAFEIHENPDVANNDTGDMEQKRKSNMYTDAPMSTFKTESDQNNVGGQGGGSNDLDDIAVLYAQPNRKSLHQSADSGNKNHVPFDAEPGEYDPPQEPPRMYKVDNNVEGLHYADLDHAPGSGVTAPKKQPEGTTDYATVDFSRTAP